MPLIDTAFRSIMVLPEEDTICAIHKISDHSWLSSSPGWEQDDINNVETVLNIEETAKEKLTENDMLSCLDSPAFRLRKSYERKPKVIFDPSDSSENKSAQKLNKTPKGTNKKGQKPQVVIEETTSKKRKITKKVQPTFSRIKNKKSSKKTADNIVSGDEEVVVSVESAATGNEENSVVNNAEESIYLNFHRNNSPLNEFKEVDLEKLIEKATKTINQTLKKKGKRKSKETKEKHSLLKRRQLLKCGWENCDSEKCSSNH